MDLTQLSPDEVVYFQWGLFKLNATIVFTWGVMAVMIVGAWLITRRVTASADVPRGQNALETIVDYMRDQIREISGGDRPDPYLPFVGTLFLFIAVANLFAIVPGYVPPTASLSTTAALAGAVFLAVPAYGIGRQGIGPYLKHYVEPNPVMLPFANASKFGECAASNSVKPSGPGNPPTPSITKSTILVFPGMLNFSSHSNWFTMQNLPRAREIRN